MRLFEFLLIVANVTGLAGVGRGKTTSRVLAIGTGVIAALQLGLEQYRWQMLPAFIVAAIVILTGLFNRNWHRGGRILLLIATLISLMLGYLFPIPVLPPTSGSYQVGTLTEVIEQDGRELVMQVWYPATIEDEPRAMYIPFSSSVGPAIAEQFNLPSFVMNHINLISIRSFENPAIADGDEGALFPLLLFSHGLGGTRSQNMFQVEEMASQGYVVVATEHHPASAIAVFPDGRIIDRNPDIVRWETPNETADAQRMVAQWASDLQLMTDAMAQFNDTPAHQLFGRVDTTAVGVFGQSTGGGASYQFCYQDDRCQAALGLDPWVVPTSDEVVSAGLDRPWLAMSTATALGEENMPRLTQFFGNSQAAAWWLVIDGTTHYDYTDFPHLSPAMKWIGIAGEYEPMEMTRLINDYTRSFFNHHLQDGTGALLYMESTIFPDVEIRRR